MLIRRAGWVHTWPNYAVCWFFKDHSIGGGSIASLSKKCTFTVAPAGYALGFATLSSLVWYMK